MDAHFLSGKKIVVAGGGLAGLSFTLALKRRWPSGLEPPQVTIYERDTAALSVGREGYSLSLAGYDDTGGLVALRELGVLDDVLKHAILGLDGGGAFKSWNRSWGEILSAKFKPAPGLPTSAIRIARKNLRQVLIDAVGMDVICWGVACMSAEKMPDGRVKLKLSGNVPPEQNTVECDLLIAADGASSKIRASLRPYDTLNYAGALQMGGNAIFPHGIPSPVDKDWGMLLSGKGVACFVSPCDDTSVIWALSHLVPTQQPGLDVNDTAEVQRVLDQCKVLGNVFAEPLKTIIEATDRKTTFRRSTMDKRPFSHDITATGSVVFMGDSNHAVSPFAGYGASLALKDGWDLVDQICKARSLDEAVKAYDAISVPRAVKVLKSSHWRIDMGHCTGLKYLYFRVLLGLGGFFLWIMGQS